MNFSSPKHAEKFAKDIQVFSCEELRSQFGMRARSPSYIQTSKDILSNVNKEFMTYC